MEWTHRPIAHLLFSGAFERFPGLRIVVTEGASYWVADMKWKWDQYFDGGHTTKKMAALMKGGAGGGMGGLPPFGGRR